MASAMVSRDEITPTPEDVLFGKDPKLYKKNPGNLYLKREVRRRMGEYAALRMREKQQRLATRELITEILAAVRDNGGRFIKRSPNGTWADAPYIEARRKVGHLLGEMYKKMRKDGVLDDDSGSEAQAEDLEPLPAFVTSTPIMDVENRHESQQPNEIFPDPIPITPQPQPQPQPEEEGDYEPLPFSTSSPQNNITEAGVELNDFQQLFLLSWANPNP